MPSLRSLGFSAFFSVVAVSALGLVTACGGDDGDSSSSNGDAGTGASGDGGSGKVDFSKGPLLPLTIGSRWTYRVTDGSDVSDKTLTAESSEVVGGTGPHAQDTAVKLVADRGTELTYSWVGADGDSVLRYREQVLDSTTLAVKTETWWDPNRPYVDGTEAHHALGASWLVEYMESVTSTKKNATTTDMVSERWTVTAVGESITVPAGTFNAIVFQKAGTSKLKTYWYVPGVGKVKEEGGQTEELTDFDIAP